MMKREPIFIETERTYMREFTLEDALELYHLNLDPEVIQYTGEKPFSSEAEARDFLSKYDQYHLFGVGRLAVIDKATRAFLGWSGLKYIAERDEYDVGFRFFKKYWNKGYATETSMASLTYGFKKLGIKKIVGRVMKENKASARVLEKSGLRYSKSIVVDGLNWSMYEITKAMFQF